MNKVDAQYIELAQNILENGVRKPNRTGVDTIGIFGAQMRFDLQEGFPLLTTKKVWFPGVAHELIWLISGNTNIQYLLDNNVHIWDEWADENGELGDVYGKQWRRWETPDGRKIDQLQNAINTIKNNPESRRIIINAWNPGEVDNMALPPCHAFFQFYIADGKLSCHLLQRSADLFLGVPFNIASYALLTSMIASVCDLEPGEFIHSFGDVHIYVNHIEQLQTQAVRIPRSLPTLTLDYKNNIDDFEFEDMKLVGYNPHPAIKGEVAV